MRKRLTNSLLFHPQRGQWRRPDDLGLAYESLWIESGDGTRTEAWWLPHPEARATLVFFHGNAGTIADRLENASALQRLGLSILMSEYRGYGNSEGSPSERGLLMDGRAALARARRLDQGKPVMLFGRSLGGAVAIDAAASEDVDALIIESTFTSLPTLARRLFPVPLLWRAVPYHFDSETKIARVRAPILVIHGDADELVPCEMGESLRAAAVASERVSFLRIAGGRHNDTWLREPARYGEAWRRLIAEVSGPGAED